MLDNLQETLGNADETSVRTETIRTQLSDSSTEAFTTARLDVMNLVAKLLDDDVYGGLIQVDRDDLDDLLRRFDVQEHVIARWERDDIGKFLDHLAEASAGGAVIASGSPPTTRRATTCCRTSALSPSSRWSSRRTPMRGEAARVRCRLRAPDQRLREHYDELFEAVGSDVDELVGLLLLMDIIVIQGGDRLFALLSPIHPLFVWHYATYAELVESTARPPRRARPEAGRRRRPTAAELPDLALRPGGGHGQGNSLTYAGRLGQLPYYGDDVEGSATDDGIDAISDLLTGYLALEPHSRAGFRVALVDPPDAGAYLSARRPSRRRGPRRRACRRLPASDDAGSPSSCGSTRTRRTGSPRSSGRSTWIAASRSRSAICPGRSSGPATTSRSTSRRSSIGAGPHNPARPAAHPDPAAGDPPAHRLPHGPPDGRAGASAGRSVRGVLQGRRAAIAAAARPRTSPSTRRRNCARRSTLAAACRLDGGRRPPGRPRPDRSAHCAS